MSQGILNESHCDGTNTNSPFLFKQFGCLRASPHDKWCAAHFSIFDTQSHQSSTWTLKGPEQLPWNRHFNGNTYTSHMTMHQSSPHKSFGVDNLHIILHEVVTNHIYVRVIENLTSRKAGCNFDTFALDYQIN